MTEPTSFGGYVSQPNRKSKQQGAPVRWDEANIARLGLISIQERIKDDFVTWEVELTRDGREARLRCDALPQYGGVPHGLDGDIAMALIDLFIEMGKPADGIVVTTAYQILKRAGLPDSGRYYQSLRMGLFRLRNALYTASEAWYDVQKHWTSVTFNHLEELEFTSAEEEGETHLTRGSLLKVRLAKPIVRSIRAQHTKPIDYQFLRSLERPLTRSLYRLLDARRYAPDDLTRVLPSYTVNLVDWARDCKITDLRANKIRRTLETAHEELVNQNYLRAVTYEGRGVHQTITYEFTPSNTTPGDSSPQVIVTVTEAPVDYEIVEAMVTHGVSRPVAVKLVRTLGADRVRRRLTTFEALLASGYKVRSKSALLVDVVRDDAGKYPEPLLPPTLPASPAHDRPARLPVDDAPPLTVELAALSHQERVDGIMRTLGVMLARHVDITTLGRLRELLERGEADPLDVGAHVTGLVFKGRNEEAVDWIASLVNR